MPKSVNRTKESNIKCENCAFKKEIQRGAESVLLCKVNNTLVDYWDKCKKFQWGNEKQYNDTPMVNLYR